MLRRPGSPSSRKRGLKPLIWIALISISGVLVLTGAHLALGSRDGSKSLGSSGGGSERVLPRLLMQGGRIGQDAAAAGNRQHSIRPDVDVEPGKVGGDSGGSSHGGLRAEPDGGSSGSSSSIAAQGAPAAAENSSGSDGSGKEITVQPAAAMLPQAPEDPVEQLGPASDLSIFAAAGTECVVTPSHGKVALLFLTHGNLPHDTLWTAWMREARGLLPRSSLAGEGAFCLKQCDDAGTSCVQQCGRAAACNPLCLDALRRRQGEGRSAAVLQQQHLFSVYVHARPTLKDYKEPSIFAGRLIPDRTIAKPGMHAIAAAAKKLVEVAALDQRNEWFVLVGDTTVPLYHPALVWQQLTHETLSRVDACPHKDSHIQRQRSTPAMKTDRFKPDRHWRKSGQWFALNRKHADLLAHDREVEPLFRKHCYVGWDDKQDRHRDCMSAEHYVPSLLAQYGLDDETTCDMSGGTAWFEQPLSDSSEQGPQPITFQPGHVTQELISDLRLSVRRTPEGASSSSSSDSSSGSSGGAEIGEEEDAYARQLCGGWAGAQQAAREAFVDASSLSADECPATLGSIEFLSEDPYQGMELSPLCPLLARKFSQAAAKWVHRVYRSCTAELGVLPCSQKLTERDNNWWS